MATVVRNMRDIADSLVILLSPPPHDRSIIPFLLCRKSMLRRWEKVVREHLRQQSDCKRREQQAETRETNESGTGVHCDVTTLQLGPGTFQGQPMFGE